MIKLSQTRNDLTDQILALNLREVQGTDDSHKVIKAGAIPTPVPIVLKSANHALASHVVLRTAKLQSVANQLVKHDHDTLGELSDALESAIKEVNVTGAGSDIQRKARMTKLFAITDKKIADTFKVMTADSLARFDQLSVILQQSNTKKLKELHGIETDGKADASELLVLGAPLKDHYEKMASDLTFRFKTAVRQGVKADETSEEIASRLTDSLPSSPIKAAEPSEATKIAVDKKLNVGVKIFDGTENSIEKVIESAVNALSNAAMQESMEDADDTDEKMGFQWVSVLDSQTCDACQFYDGNQWDDEYEPVGEAPEYPGDAPVHFGCRCAVIPVDLEGENPAVHQRIVGDVLSKPKDISFEDYLSQFSDKELKQAFGEGAISNYRRGDITPAQLIGQKDSLMTLEKFKESEL